MGGIGATCQQDLDQSTLTFLQCPECGSDNVECILHSGHRHVCFNCDHEDFFSAGADHHRRQEALSDIVPIGSRWAGITGNIVEVAETDGDRVRVFMVDDPEDTCWEEADKWAKYMKRL